MLSPVMGNDPMFAEFHIQGYDGTDGSHQQFLLVQGPQMHAKPADLTLEAAGSYILNLGTVYRALFTTLKIEPGRTLFVEGAATGTGMETAKAAARNGLKVTGLGFKPGTGRAGQKAGRNRRHQPQRRSHQQHLDAHSSRKRKMGRLGNGGRTACGDYRAQNERKLADYSVSHAGEHTFPRSFQLLETGRHPHLFRSEYRLPLYFYGQAGQRQPPCDVPKSRVAGRGSSFDLLRPSFAP